MTGFVDSNEHAFRRLVRSAIRKSEMTKHQQAVTLAIVDLWFHHRSGREGVIRPGRKHLAAKARVSVRTVASTLAKLRDADVLLSTGYAKGGRNATRYEVNTIRLLAFCGAKLPDWVAGELAEFARLSGAGLHGYPMQDLHTVISTVGTCFPRTSQSDDAGDLPVVGGRDV